MFFALKPPPLKSPFYLMTLLMSLVAAYLGLLAGSAAANPVTEQATAHYFDARKTDPNAAIAFLRRMPKGGDLHNHVGGAIYAETYIQWAVEDKLCLNSKMLALSYPAPSGCPTGTADLAAALSQDEDLYGKLVDAWSMRNLALSGQTGHDHFFDAFGKFGAASGKRYGDMIADVAERSAGEGLSYLELLLTPESAAKNIGKLVSWNGNPAETRTAILAYAPAKPEDPSSVADLVKRAQTQVSAFEKRRDELLHCGTPQAMAGCGVQIRYLSQISRSLPSSQAYAQMVVFAELAKADGRFVGINLVQPEDDPAALANFRPQMVMLDYLHGVYPRMQVSLHAGELAPGLVLPEEMRFHIAESVRQGHARRIGHGVDVMHENEPYKLLKDMADQGVMVEVCLSSNDGILGVKGKDHPFKVYEAYGVPVALATDDAGIARSDISREFLKAVEEQGVGYIVLKRMVRNSLEYAFIEGQSLWQERKTFKPVAACAKADAPACLAFVKASPKAALQLKLEQDLDRFEQSYAQCGKRPDCP